MNGIIKKLVKQTGKRANSASGSDGAIWSMGAMGITSTALKRGVAMLEGRPRIMENDKMPDKEVAPKKPRSARENRRRGI